MGHSFLKITEEKLMQNGMKRGPASDLADFAKELCKRKLRSYLSYKILKNLREVLEIKCRIVWQQAVTKLCVANILPPYCMFPFTSPGESPNKDFQFEIDGKEATDCVNYVLKKIIGVIYKELIAITEGKQKDLVVEFMQNVTQLKSSYHTNMRKRKASETFDDEFDYLYGIITTALDWYFLMYTLERIYCLKTKYHVIFTEDILENDVEPRQGIKKTENAKIKAKKADIKDMYIELLKQIRKEYTRHNSEKAEFKVRIEELEKIG
ncbi:hypothetical protein C1645_841219 [Glomus cerebriforme]|uniref:Uncharacterized protein n=1 Tax=Glomus cerebriforme TaxID=658196 RepID=A0A397SA76_9GLOM|nr:hypothetical protein C1645_841219 [Glomus cerebriforme]